jgi:hypothetical protein
MRHLPPDSALGALRRGKQIEQFLGAFGHGKEHVIRWAALSPAKDHITLYLSEVIDVGSDVFQDVPEFPPPDPGEQTRGKITGSTASPERRHSTSPSTSSAQPATAGSTTASPVTNTPATAAAGHPRTRDVSAPPDTCSREQQVPPERPRR